MTNDRVISQDRVTALPDIAQADHETYASDNQCPIQFMCVQPFDPSCDQQHRDQQQP